MNIYLKSYNQQLIKITSLLFPLLTEFIVMSKLLILCKLPRPGPIANFGVII